MTVLITRPLPDARAFADLCDAAGVVSLICPLMQPVFFDEPPDVTGIGALAFTSANGVRAYARLMTSRASPVFAVGEATAQSARQAGFKTVFIADGDVASLSRLIAKEREVITGDVLHITGTRQAGDLSSALQKLGVNGRKSALYVMDEIEALPGSAIAALNDVAKSVWVALFSPRTAVLFVRLVAEAGLENRLGKMRAACLSEAVAEEVRMFTWERVAVAKQRNSASMLALITKKA